MEDGRVGHDAQAARGVGSTGGPLTDFRRGRRNLPLPSERVKSVDSGNQVTPHLGAKDCCGARKTGGSETPALRG